MSHLDSSATWLKSSGALALAFAAALAGAPLGPAAAQQVLPAFPASADAEHVLPWLAANTSVKPADILAMGSQAVVSLDGVTAGSGAPSLALVREEIIDEGYAGRREARSARLEVELDCASGAYHIRRVVRFVLPDLKGPGTEVATPPGWGHAGDGSAMARISKAACARVPAPPRAAAAPETTPIVTNAPSPAPSPPAAKPAASPAPAPAAPPAPRPQPAEPAAKPAPSPAQTQIAAAAPKPPAPLPAKPTPSPAPTQVAAAAPKPASGPFRVQLGTYSTVENAHRAGADLRRQFAKAVQDREVSVDEAAAKGRSYFLLLVKGFAARAEAAAFCKAVSVEPAACLIRR